MSRNPRHESKAAGLISVPGPKAIPSVLYCLFPSHFRSSRKISYTVHGCRISESLTRGRVIRVPFKHFMGPPPLKRLLEVTLAIEKGENRGGVQFVFDDQHLVPDGTAERAIFLSHSIEGSNIPSSSNLAHAQGASKDCWPI